MDTNWVNTRTRCWRAVHDSQSSARRLSLPLLVGSQTGGQIPLGEQIGVGGSEFGNYYPTPFPVRCALEIGTAVGR